MIPDTLYDLAFQFKRTKLWKKLFDSELFAVRHTDGSIGYCCVMGIMGEHIALAVYPGEVGLDSYRRIGRDQSQMDSFEIQENALSQDCTMVSFENKAELHPREVQEMNTYCAAHGLTLRGRKAYPQFQRIRPHFLPWYLEDETDQAHLMEAMEAACEVAERLQTATAEALGFAEGAPFDRKIPLLEKKDGAFLWSEIALPDPRPVCYPSPEIRNEIILAKIAKSRKRGSEWACDIFMHVSPISDGASDSENPDEPVNAPFFPYLLLIVDNQAGMVINVQLAQNPEDYSEQFIQAVLDIMLNHGKPTRILVCNERTYAFFDNMAARIGVKLVMKKSIPLLEDAKQGFYKHFADEEDMPEDGMDQLMEILRDPTALSDMPDEMLAQLVLGIDMGVFPDDIVEIIKREFKRRGK